MPQIHMKRPPPSMALATSPRHAHAQPDAGGDGRLAPGHKEWQDPGSPPGPPRPRSACCVQQPVAGGDTTAPGRWSPAHHPSLPHSRPMDTTPPPAAAASTPGPGSVMAQPGNCSGSASWSRPRPWGVCLAPPSKSFRKGGEWQPGGLGGVCPAGQAGPGHSQEPHTSTQSCPRWGTGTASEDTHGRHLPPGSRGWHPLPTAAPYRLPCS